ncbi:MAG: endolytic transglycosylase MltG [Cyclobacteriaceae bacterium]|nr:endolytic transglycosylase MltG [Cyclobacteriaceae bacterium]
MDKRKILILSVVIITILSSSFTFYFYQVIYVSNFLVEKENRYLYIPTGATFEDVQRIIYDERFVNDAVSFGMLAKFMKYNELVKPGKYLIEKNSNNRDVIRKLRAGDQAPLRITFNNARLLTDVAEKLTVNLELDPGNFLEIISSANTASKYGFNQETFRCMFIPNTYEVYWTVSGEKLADRLHEEYERFWDKERLEKAKKLGMDPVQVTILASIVQAETSHNEESPIVAGLYLNRLKRNMPLQADPTLIYAAGDFTIKRVLNIHKEIESPYNTYKYAGLPPGPINFPSIISIDAVLNYKEHKYIYMCAKEDFSGYHNFSSNLRQHSINAKKYQQALNKAKLFR